jgi:hypothetical protein
MPKKTCHNKKKEEPIVPIVPTKVVEPVAKVTTQLVKPIKIPLRCPSIIALNFVHLIVLEK